MPTEIDALSISIEAKAQKANSSIDKLVSRLDVLSNSLGKSQNGSNNLVALGRGVESLSRGMQGFKGVGEAKFIRLANGINQLANINTQGLNNAASSLSHMTRAFNNIGAVSQNAVQVSDLAKNLGKLGNKSVTNAITNIPQLATAMNNLMTTLSKAPKVSENVIRMTNALANLSAQGAKVGSASNSISKGLNRASNSATRARASFGGLASAIGKFYATYFLLIRAFKGLGKAIDSTADYLEAYNYFNVALGKIGSDWSHQFEQYGYESAEAYADSFSTRLQQRLSGLSGLSIQMNADGTGLLTETGLQNLGLNLQEVTQYASQLASVTNSVGQTGEVSLATASSITKLGSDLSSLFNLDYADVMQNLQSGLIGQSRALYKYGIDITNATLQTYAYELGLEKAVSEMTQAEKMQLRILAILDQSKVAWGDLANTINSPSNMMRQFSNNVKEVGMVLGQLFIPALQKIMPVLNGATIALKRLLVSLANLLGIKLDLDSFGQGFNSLEDDTDELADSLDGVSKSAKKAYMGLLGFDKLNVIKTPDDANKSKGSGVSGGTIDLTDEILDATKEYEKAWQDAFDQMENKAQDFADIIEKIFKPIADIIKEDFEDIEWEAISENIGDLSEALQPYAENFGKGLLDFFEDLGDISVTTINNLFGEDGAVTKLTDWLNKGDPEKAEKWGYAFGVIATGLLAFAGLSGVATTISLLGKGITLLVSPLTNLVSLAKGSTALVGLATALKSLGGVGGLFTMDLGLIFGAGTAMEIGLTIGAGLIAGIIAAWAGFDFGKWLGEKLFPEDAQWYKEFKWFGEGGFFKELENAGWANALIALNNMATDLASVILPDEVASEIQMGFEKAVRLLENYDWSNLINDIKENFWLVAFDTSLMQPNPIELVVDFFNQISEKSKVFAEGIKKMFELLIGGIHDLISKTKFDFNIGGLNSFGNIGTGIKAYATGGFPKEDGLFYANHTELVGKFSNGKTAVANNQQITDGIEEAAYRGMMRAFSNQGNYSNVNVTLEGDAGRLFRVVRKEADSFSRTTGRPAFS